MFAPATLIMLMSMVWSLSQVIGWVIHEWFVDPIRLDLFRKTHPESIRDYYRWQIGNWWTVWCFLMAMNSISHRGEIILFVQNRLRGVFRSKMTRSESGIQVGNESRWTPLPPPAGGVLPWRGDLSCHLLNSVAPFLGEIRCSTCHRWHYISFKSQILLSIQVELSINSHEFIIQA